MKGGEKNLLKSQVYQNDQRPLKRAEKMFPRKKIFFVRAASPPSPLALPSDLIINYGPSLRWKVQDCLRRTLQRRKCVQFLTPYLTLPQ